MRERALARQALHKEPGKMYSLRRTSVSSIAFTASLTLRGLLVASAVALASVHAKAAPITFTGSSGNLSTSVTFDASGSDLIVTLTNTSLFDVLVPSDVLTAVFYDIDPALVLSRTSAALAPGSAAFFGPTDPGGVVGGEWAYADSLSGAPGTAGLGISSAGFGLFGPGDLFPGTDLDAPESPDGLNYGITSAGDDLGTGNAQVTGSRPLIQNSVVFTLSGLPVGFDPSTQISNVTAQYGTGLGEPSFPLVPEPATLGLVAIGALGACRRRR